jgi:predicted Na+-dependent transporter
LLAITLTPLGAGMLLQRLFPVTSRQWQPRLERLGSVLVILLVLALAVRYGRAILTGPLEPLLAALVLVAMFVLPPLLEPVAEVRRTVVLVTLIRNLTLVLSLVAVLPDSTTLLPTVLAFGLFMYLTAGVLLWRWRA